VQDAFLRALVESPRDDVSRLVYADWLEEQDDPVARLQAEYLRLTVQGQPGEKRLQELAARLDPEWLAVVSRIPIENCGRARTGEEQLPVFRFACDRNWQDLQPTAEQTVRHCEGCKKDVHYCATIREARQHARVGHCIAVDLGVIRRENDVPRPDPIAAAYADVVGMVVPDWEIESERMALDTVSAEREQRRFDQQRPASDFDLAWEEDDLEDLVHREAGYRITPFEEIDLRRWRGVTRLYESEGTHIMTCLWGRSGVRVEVATGVTDQGPPPGWWAWVPSWFVPRALRGWAAVEATLAEAPSHVWDTAYQVDVMPYRDMGGPTAYHQLRDRERTDLVVWRSYFPKPGPGVLRCLEAYRRLCRTAWWCAWLWGGTRRISAC
jgi:uncharacterized protein (TIGR02996 family)